MYKKLPFTEDGGRVKDDDRGDVKDQSIQDLSLHESVVPLQLIVFNVVLAQTKDDLLAIM